VLSISRRVGCVCSSGTATLIARGIIGRSIKNYVSNVPPSYAMRRYSRTHRPRKTCPICFLPMPVQFISCMTLPPANLSFVPISNYAGANEDLTSMDTEIYYACCGKTICKGCIHSFAESGNIGNCPFCKAEIGDNTDEDVLEQMMKRVEANDPTSIFMLAHYYEYGGKGLQHDHAKALELYTMAADLGSSKARYNLAIIYRKEGDLKKAKTHYEAAAMAGNEVARNTLGDMDMENGNTERALKHCLLLRQLGIIMP
jgi:hypothetical protein